MKLNFKKIFGLLMAVMACIVLPLEVFAQADIGSGLQAVGDQTGLGTQDIRITIARVIRTGLSLLGIVATVMVVYAGFLWMTSAGNDEKIERAKKILINGVIGLIIIFSSIAIVSFVLNGILRATGGNLGGGSGSGGPGGGGFGGSGTTQMVVAGFRPSGDVPIRNVVAQVVFSRPVNEATVQNSIQVFKNDTAENIEVDLRLSSERTVSITPKSTCPSPNQDRFCYDSNTEIRVTILNSIRSSTGQALVCSPLNPCNFVFRVGDLIDVSAPAINIQTPRPNERVSPLELMNIQARVRDDSQVSHADFFANETQFDSVPASGQNLTDVFIQADWDPGLAKQGENHTMAVTAVDIAGNSATSTVSIRLNPAHCYNGQFDQNLGETGVDCGGACGFCSDASCVTDGDCAKGACVGNICVARPKITNVDPPGGGIGTYVLIEGELLGGSGGQIYFTGSNGGEVLANIPASCAAWGRNSVLVEVPVGAADGPIRFVSSNGLSDSTNDNFGPFFQAVFDVNDVRRPNLCAVSPDTARQRQQIQLSGSGFGSERGESFVTFSSSPISNFSPESYVSWGSNALTVTAPVVEQGDFTVRVTVGGETSNPVRFFVRGVEGSEQGALPNISSISPNSRGARGDYITINGSAFGTQLGQVLFVNSKNEREAVGSVNFPTQCTNDLIWQENKVVVRVPESYTAGGQVEFGAYNILLVRNDGARSNRVNFEVANQLARPGICAIDPDRELAGAEVVVYGDNLGDNKGIEKFQATIGSDAAPLANTPFSQLVFSPSLNSSIVSWSPNEIKAIVPAGGISGSVFVRNGEVLSNSLSFTYGDPAGEDVVPGRVGGYGWSFSTGDIPIRPELVVACQQNPPVLSAVPNIQFNRTSCLNVKIMGHFNTAMNKDSLESAISVRECLNDACTLLVGNPLQVKVTVPTIANDEKTRFEVVHINNDKATVDWPANKRFVVIVNKEVRSFSGIPLGVDARWIFATGGQNDRCDIESVVISPERQAFNQKGQVASFSANAVARQCLVLNNDFTWDWSVAQPNLAATVEDGSCADAAENCVIVRALLDGQTLLRATASENGQATGPSGTAELRIQFTDPYISSFRPNCGEACLNADIGGRFNIPVKISGSNGVEDLQNVILEKCDNELCPSPQGINSSTSCLQTQLDSSGEEGCVDFTIRLNSGTLLEQGSFYQVRVSKEIQSTSGKPLSRLTDGGQFIWRFASGSNVCAIQNVVINPGTAIARNVSDRQTFVAVPLGPPDSCSESGQRLNALAYDWNFPKPVDDANVADWVQLLKSNASVVNGCTAQCLPVGSLPYAAVCGNGIVESGEECDDRNVQNGDGCSSSCLREARSDTFDLSGTCGDGRLQRLALEQSDGQIVVGTVILSTVSQAEANNRTTYPFGWVGEECDPGENGDWSGCDRNTCMNLGSTAVDAVCGNGDIAWSSNRGGEDCDDSNRLGGDGCSAQCLNEGSISINRVPAVCGDGVITAPFETCDPKFKDQSWCPSNCLKPGVIISQPNACGDGVVQAWEDCDVNNPESGDGCSEFCKFLGSSLNHKSPSICGDGIVGSGEYGLCEGDGQGARVAPMQIARILDSAPALVSGPQNQVSATILANASEASTVRGRATYTLSCSARTDRDCKDPNVNGVGAGNCCSTRPKIVNVIPADNSTDVCLNALTNFEVTTNLNRDLVAENIELEFIGQGCPSGHTRKTAEGRISQSFAWMRIYWNKLVPRVAAQNPGICIMPVSRVELIKISQNINDNRHLVRLFTESAFAENSPYRFRILGDDNIENNEFVGLASNIGARLLGTRETTFRTGSQICEVDRVDVRDPAGNPEGFFGQSGQERDFIASAISIRGGRSQEIQSIEGFYSWNWLNWRESSNGVIVDVRESNKETGKIAAARESGEALAIAELQIANSDKKVAGALNVVTFFCENPWPSMEAYPFRDSEGTDSSTGAVEGRAWTNFATYYCKDRGVTGINDDLPGLRVTLPPQQPNTGGIFKEYLFEVMDGSGDAIGLRVAGNPQYLTPIEWYRQQGFSGNPTAITLDGLPAIRDGRTVYVVAPNQDKENKIFSNVYIVSHNQLASQSTQDIFSQFLENFKVLANIENEQICKSGSRTGDICSNNLDCGEAGLCGNLKDQLIRDARRINDLVELSRRIDLYAEANGRCSLTNSQACTGNSMCPAGETCVPQSPRLASGTFVPGMSVSTWPSWNENLGGLVGAMPIDPVNKHHAGCPLGEDGNENMTCFDQSSGLYQCKEGSLVYHYRIEPAGKYVLSTDLEYRQGFWASNLPKPRTGRLHITVPLQYLASLLFVGQGDSPDVEALRNKTMAENIERSGFASASFICKEGNIFGNSAVCGDGIVGQGEVCEPGVTRATEPCTLADNRPGLRAVSCANDCKSFIGGGECLPFSCGNGVVEVGEQCDDGVNNGQYGFCGIDCTYRAGSAAFCGDGLLSAGEVCDCGLNGSGIASGGGSCSASAANGAYTANPVNGCSWDCRGPAAYCGDRVVQSAAGEQCDGNVQSWAGFLCSDNTPCNIGESCGTGEICGQASTPAAGQACTPARVCVAGNISTLGQVCGSNAACDTTGSDGRTLGDGLCSMDPIPRHRVRGCGAPGTANACSFGNWSACVPASTCGNGVVEEGEQCDDGNRENGDSCTNACRFNVCGDGFVRSGIEQCDSGALNGIPCNAPYGGNCSFCSTQCNLVVNTGEFCGDSVWNREFEFCDGNQVRFVYVTTSGAIDGYCLPEEIGTTKPGGGAVCLEAGVCNGGARNGQLILRNRGNVLPTGYGIYASCGTGVAQFPDCNRTCTAACPFTYDFATVQLRSDVAGAGLSNEITLTRASDQFDSLNTAIRQNASMVFPACRVSSGLIGDVEIVVNRPSKAIVNFVLDFSSSMNSPIVRNGPSRMTVMITSLKAGVDQLFDELDEEVEIRIIGYGPRITTAPNAVINQISSLSVLMEQDNNINNPVYNDYIWRYHDHWGIDNATNVSHKDWEVAWYSNTRFNVNNRQSLLSFIDSLEVAFNGEWWGPTPSKFGLATASYILEQDWNSKPLEVRENTEKVLVYMTDGSFDFAQGICAITSGGCFLDGQCPGFNSGDRRNSCNHSHPNAQYLSMNPYYSACRAFDKGQQVYTLSLLSGEQIKQSELTRNNVSNNTIDGLVSQLHTGRSNSSICQTLFDSQAWYVQNGGRRPSTSYSLVSDRDRTCFQFGLSKAALGTSATNHAACMASGNPDPVSQIDYAYSGNTEAEFSRAFEQIINSINTVQLRYGGNAGIDDYVPIREGRGVNIPLPEGFECMPGILSLPISVAYKGDEGGRVRISNLRFAHCAQ